MWTTFVSTFVCTLHFLCAKIWLFGKLVVLLHCKEQKCPFVDVPWCNGSTRVFGSLSPRSNRSGTTSPYVQVSEIPSLKSQGVISGGMIPKIDCCVEAVRRGVLQTNIIDGRIPHSILMELFTDEGFGTMFHG